jgi:hypothetical protein
MANMEERESEEVPNIQDPPEVMRMKSQQSRGRSMCPGNGTKLIAGIVKIIPFRTSRHLFARSWMILSIRRHLARSLCTQRSQQRVLRFSVSSPVDYKRPSPAFLVCMPAAAKMHCILMQMSVLDKTFALSDGNNSIRQQAAYCT